MTTAVHGSFVPPPNFPAMPPISRSSTSNGLFEHAAGPLNSVFRMGCASNQTADRGTESPDETSGKTSKCKSVTWVAWQVEALMECKRAEAIEEESREGREKCVSPEMKWQNIQWKMKARGINCEVSQLKKTMESVPANSPVTEQTVEEEFDANPATPEEVREPIPQHTEANVHLA
ncbi:hypothetical protein R1sor_019562 [Riccia sorocarpa]|uniref:Uncharacterized protein n=1 Tax=Riccia sorocarpa TaxID=122646 RepID=A0ABD3IGN5_9MARC